MTPQECDRLIDRLTELAEYYEKPKSEAQIAIYVQALADLPITDVLRATGVLVQTSAFYPKVSEIRTLVLGSVEDQSELAWTELLREIRREGYTGKPNLPAATMEVIWELWGSWVNLCQTLPGEGAELLGWAKRFKASYGAHQRQTHLAVLPPKGRLLELAEESGE